MRFLYNLPINSFYGFFKTYQVFKNLIGLLIILIVISSCKTKKVIANGASSAKGISSKKIAKKHISSEFDKKTVDAKLKVHYQNPKEKIGFSVRMKIKKDEVIWLKGTKYITVFKAKITPTKVSYYSPYYKHYFEGDFSMLKKILGTDINFNQLQNLLLGQAITDVTSEKQNIEFVDNSYRLSPRKQPNLFDIFFYVNPSHFKLNKQSLVNTIKDRRLDVLYPKYLQKDGTFFPENINIRVKKSSNFTNIDMTVRSVVFNTELNTPFAIPSGYKKIKL